MVKTQQEVLLYVVEEEDASKLSLEKKLVLLCNSASFDFLSLLDYLISSYDLFGFIYGVSRILRFTSDLII